ncbi:unnamed protein product [Darwinula stevensoni]|uniref:DNA oxidative demethylase ALKBH2 n=1 Tax=Darwinula stevensoni TaxID=69355 RepID=A0A7R8X715_9CRUS|nr:unnamed protein product [Darwinula stevensoni]CAG0888211.1 unnamed protein product [Darwinula stevensoni]
MFYGLMKRSSSTLDRWLISKKKGDQATDGSPLESVPKGNESDEVTEQSMVEALGRLDGRDIRWQQKEASNLSLSYTMLLRKREADFVFASLENSIQYYSGELAQIMVHGKWCPIPRKQVAYGDPGLSYHFSGIAIPAKPWTPLLKGLCDAVSCIASTKFNFVLINRYKDGSDRVGEHKDDEIDLDPAAPIASVSLGQPRDFVFRHQDARGRHKAGSSLHEPVTLMLEHGSLLLMNPPTNLFWYHSLPPRKRAVQPRINLTFRKLVTKPSQ